ncbi:MAG TPA: hypothetical protein VI485_21390 [Vicinamibacterales bacterium]|nr:hypothetical protein [Vicinamibacterales bacterium]
MPDAKNWIVTTSEDRPLSEITSDLKKAGFVVGEVLDAIGSITGTADDHAVKQVRSIPGVVDVSPDAPIDIGPPGSKDTW